MLCRIDAALAETSLAPILTLKASAHSLLTQAEPLRPKLTILFVDGCSINHSRMAGLASFIGVLTDLPTIGVTKNALCVDGKIPGKTWLVCLSSL